MIGVEAVCFQCARAVIRSKLWSGEAEAGLPTAGEMLAEASGGAEGGPAHDAAWPERAARTMW